MKARYVKEAQIRDLVHGQGKRVSMGFIRELDAYVAHVVKHCSSDKLCNKSTVRAEVLRFHFYSNGLTRR